MTERAKKIPDKLVQAAAEALNRTSEQWWVREAATNDDGPMPGIRVWPLAEIALRAAFAKLGECEAAKNAIVVAFTPSAGQYADRWRQMAVEWAEAALTALAREFGGQE